MEYIFQSDNIKERPISLFVFFLTHLYSGFFYLQK